MSGTEQNKPNLHIAGVPVHFPHKPYRAQVALMHAVVTAVKKSDNALVESPTGTGKSLALLCSSLAVQQHLCEVRKQREIESEIKNETINQVNNNDDEKRKEEREKMINIKSETIAQSSSCINTKQTPSINYNSIALTKQQQPSEIQIVNDNKLIDSDDDDFQPTPQRQLPDVSWQQPITKQQRKRSANNNETEEQPENAFMLHPRHENPLDELSSSPSSYSSSDENPNKNDKKKSKSKKKPVLKKVPRIFYATRTHNQVTQVVRELRKTTYRPSMCILASRREYCVNDGVREQPSRDDLCKRMVYEKGCSMYFEAPKLSCHSELTNSAWDIEELTTLGRRINACPYYASHELYQQAQLILCPYSFLIDPIVRAARGINLKDDVVILDEAHNIENQAREAASFQTDLDVIKRAVDEIDNIILTTRIHKKDKQRNGSGLDELVKAYRRIKSLFLAMLTLVENVIESQQFKLQQQQQQQHSSSSFNNSSRNGNGNEAEQVTYERAEMLTLLAEVGINITEVKHWRNAHDFIAQFGDGNEEERFIQMGFDQRPAVDIHADYEYDDGNGDDDDNDTSNNSTTQRQSIVGHGYGGSEPFRLTPDDDNWVNENESNSSPSTNKRGRFKRRRGRRRRGHNDNNNAQRNKDVRIANCLNVCLSLLTSLNYLFHNDADYILAITKNNINLVSSITLSIHCLHAGVSFRDVSTIARTIIVASGTLSPMCSFAGELGTRFHVSKSLPHVVDVKRQLYVGIFATAPVPPICQKFIHMDATFAGAARFEFQDALAGTLHDICRVTPGGILVFFPSYRLIRTLENRWRTTGAWSNLIDVKNCVLVEPPQRGPDFDAVVNKYNSLVAPSYDDEEECENHYDEENEYEIGNRKKGALLLAVCRGKLSEGIDFRDDASRAVVLVGIPFPHKNNIVVEYKRKWNDRARQQQKQQQQQNEKKETDTGERATEIQSGADWYEMQAFRALNQALGRAVRHRYDYGAILLIDPRFTQPRVISQLPKWTRDAVCNVKKDVAVNIPSLSSSFSKHEKTIKELETFFHNVQEHIDEIAQKENKKPSI